MYNKLLKFNFAILLVVIPLLYSCEKEEILKEESFENISEHDARLVAINFANLNESDLKSKSKFLSEKEIIEVLIVPDDKNEPMLYIVNFRPESFVIVSATKKEIPILAFSDNSIFNIKYASPEVKQWIKLRKEKIRILKEKNICISDDLEEKWLSYISPPDPNTGDNDPIYDPELDPSNTNYLACRTFSKGPLTRTTWGQGDGYNNLLDPINGIIPPTGCVSTAMAQVMKYHEHPKTYNWDAMPNAYGTNETAKLFKDIWVAAELYYAEGSSYSTFTKARNALINTFGYSSSVTIKSYTFSTIVAEINNNRPVIIEGYSSSNYGYGHAWICDGYFIKEYYKNQSGIVTSREEYLRMNWGYNGEQNNGYYEKGDFTFNYSNGTSINFKFYNGCLVNIKPEIGIID